MASDFSIRHAAHIIKNGGVIAYPTDTIYGLGCDPFNSDAVERINTIKQRPSHKRFILLAGHIDQIKPLLLIDKEEEKTIAQSTVPTSWIIAANQNAPAWLTGKDNTLTVRISNNSDVQRLCQTLGHAIVSTSANISGKAPAKNTMQLHLNFHGIVDKILASDRSLTGKPSKIIRLCDNYVLRE